MSAKTHQFIQAELAFDYDYAIITNSKIQAELALDCDYAQLCLSWSVPGFQIQSS